MAANNICCRCLRRRAGERARPIFSALQRHCGSLPCGAARCGLHRLSKEASLVEKAEHTRTTRRRREKGVFAERRLARAI